MMTYSSKTCYNMSHVARKLAFGVSDQVQHKPGYAASEDRRRLDISDLEGRGIALCSENKGTDQLHGYCEVADQLQGYCAADLRLCFCIFKKQVFT